MASIINITGEGGTVVRGGGVSPVLRVDPPHGSLCYSSDCFNSIGAITVQHKSMGCRKVIVLFTANGQTFCGSQERACAERTRV